MEGFVNKYCVLLPNGLAGTTRLGLTKEMAADLDALLAAERERCAKVAEEFSKTCNCACVDIGVGILHEPTWIRADGKAQP